MSLLELEDDILVTMLSSLSHIEVCRSQMVNRKLKQLGARPYIWKSLFNRVRRTPILSAPVDDWLSAYRALNPEWDDIRFEIRHPIEGRLSESGHRLDMPLEHDMILMLEEKALHSWQSLETPPPGVGGQDPKVVPIGADAFLVLAGASYQEPQGGIHLTQGADAYLLDAHVEPVSWRGITVKGRPPPSLHGACVGAFGDGILADRIVTFGGGSHVECTDCVSQMDLSR